MFVLLHVLPFFLLGIVAVFSGDQVDDLQDFVLDVVLVDEGQNLVLDRREICKLENRWSLIIVFTEEGHDEHFEVRVHVIMQRLKRLLGDLGEHILHRLASEGLLERDEFVEDDTDGPDVCLAIVGLPTADFGRHEIGRSATSHGLSVRVVQLTRDTKVAKLANTILSDENVLSLDVSVEDIFVVHHHDSHDDVGESAQDLVRRKVTS